MRTVGKGACGGLADDARPIAPCPPQHRRWARRDRPVSHCLSVPGAFAHPTSARRNEALILRRPPTEVGLARLRQPKSVEIGNSRFRWAAVSKDGHGHGRASRHPSRRARKRTLLRMRAEFFSRSTVSTKTLRIECSDQTHRASVRNKRHMRFLPICRFARSYVRLRRCGRPLSRPRQWPNPTHRKFTPVARAA